MIKQKRWSLHWRFVFYVIAIKLENTKSHRCTMRVEYCGILKSLKDKWTGETLALDNRPLKKVSHIHLRKVAISGLFYTGLSFISTLCPNVLTNFFQDAFYLVFFFCQFQLFRINSYYTLYIYTYFIFLLKIKY